MSIAAMNWTWQLPLKPTIKLVLMALADAADDSGYCWPSVPTLAHKTCMDERSVQRILKILKDSNFIEVQARYRKDGSPTSNKYRLAIQSTGDKLTPPPPRQSSRKVVTSIPPRGGLSVTQTTNEPAINLKKPQHQAISNTSDNLILPSQLTEKEKLLAIARLSTLNPTIAQEIADELAWRLNSNSIKSSPLGYLRSLINSANAGNFIAHAGLKVAIERQKETHRSTSKSTKEFAQAEPTPPTEIKNRLAAMHKALSRKNNPTNKD